MLLGRGVLNVQPYTRHCERTEVFFLVCLRWGLVEGWERERGGGHVFFCYLVYFLLLYYTFSKLCLSWSFPWDGASLSDRSCRSSLYISLPAVTRDIVFQLESK